MTTQLKKDLMAVNLQIKTLSKNIEKMIVAADKLETTNPSKKTKAKTAKEASAKKKAAQSKPKASPPAKSTDNLTAADTVLGFIQRSRNGINSLKLIKKTGFNQKKIANIIYKLKKQGKIQSPEKGAYVKA